MARYPREHIEPGTVFGNLTIVEEIERSGTNRRFLCTCACGAEKIAFLNNMKAGRTTSCGCTYVYGGASRAAILASRRAQESDEGRLCLTCNTWKPWSAFSSDRRRTRGKTSNCTDCARWRSIRACYGISREEWVWLLETQQGVCVLCGEADNRGVRLSIDHDHTCCDTGRACKKCIRGLLCDLCNRMLGLAEQRPALRQLFHDYLHRRPFLSRSAVLA